MRRDQEERGRSSCFWCHDAAGKGGLCDVHRRQSVSLKWLRTLRPTAEWGEGDGDVIWWTLPISEPPYVGTPLDDGFPDYATHWSPLPIPIPIQAVSNNEQFPK